MERLVVGGGQTDASKLTHAASLRTLKVSLAGSGKRILSIAQNAQLPLESRIEAYTLSVPSDGSTATLSAESTLGLFRGLTTFTQLWYTYDHTIYTITAPISVQDKPAYVRANCILVGILFTECSTIAISRPYVGHSSQLVSLRYWLIMFIPRA